MKTDNHSKLANGFIKIVKYTYLKTPLYSWTFYNTDGGSFSNSGQVKSFNRCINHARMIYGKDVRVQAFSFDGEKETFIPEMSNYQDGGK